MRGEPRWYLWGAGVVAVGAVVAGGAWWLAGSAEAAEPEPLRVECDGPGFAGLENFSEFDPNLATAPTAIRTEPVPDENTKQGVALDYVPPSSENTPWRMGYQLDRDAATVSYTSAQPASDPAWQRRISDAPLDIISDIDGFPGHRELVTVTAQLSEGDASIMVVLDRDGAIRISCTAYDVPAGEEIGPPLSTADGALLLVPNVDEEEQVWVEAHSIESGEYLWSAQGASYAADEDHVYVAAGDTVTAYDRENGDKSWDREPLTNFEDAPDNVGQRDPSDTWDLVPVDDEVYAYRHGSRRVLALDTYAGDIEWDVVPGDNEMSRLNVTRLDSDNMVLLDFGKDHAMRAPDKYDWRWLHRGADYSRVTSVLRRPGGEPTLVAIRAKEADNSRALVYTQSGDPLISHPNSGTDHSFAVADTMIYVLDESERVVTGYELQTGDELWSTSVPTPQDAEPGGISAHDGGFRVHFGQSTLRYSEGAG